MDGISGSKIFYCILIYCCIYSTINAQNIPVGSWRFHSTFTEATAIESFQQKVFTAAQSGMYYLDLEDNSISTASTVDGLSSNSISLLKKISNDLLVVGHENGAIDFLDNELALSSFTEIVNTSFENKEINDAILINDQLYFATDFGLFSYNLEEQRIIDSYTQLGGNASEIPIQSMALKKDNLYLASDDQLLSIKLNTSANLKDYRNWNRINYDTPISNILELGGDIYVSFRDSVLIKRNGQTETIFETDSIHTIQLTNDALYILSSDSLWKLNEDNSFETIISSVSANDITAINDRFFVSTEHGIEEITAGNRTNKIRPNASLIKFNTFKQIEDYTINISDKENGFSVFAFGRWENSLTDENGNMLPAFADVELNLNTGNAIFLAKNRAIYEWDVEKVRAIDSIPESFNNVYALETDNLGEMWVIADQNSSYQLINLESGTVLETNISTSSNFNDYLISAQGIHMIATNNGLYAINSEINRRLNTSLGNGNLPSNVITCLEQDFSASVWIGTTEGIVYISNFSSLLNSENFNATTPIFEGFPLFDNDRINDILFDGGNRMWVMNADGAWLFDEPIDRNIIRLESENSPLVNNNIQQASWNPINGELFLKSSAGVFSYRTDASRAGLTHSDVKVFPNPYRMQMNNQITISGLAFNSEVFITDLNGNVITRGTANGGTFNWNLENEAERKIKRGVYLVFSVNADGSESYQTRFAVVPD